MRRGARASSLLGAVPDGFLRYGHELSVRLPTIAAPGDSAGPFRKSRGRRRGSRFGESREGVWREYRRGAPATSRRPAAAGRRVRARASAGTGAARPGGPPDAAAPVGDAAGLGRVRRRRHHRPAVAAVRRPVRAVHGRDVGSERRRAERRTAAGGAGRAAPRLPALPRGGPPPGAGGRRRAARRAGARAPRPRRLARRAGRGPAVGAARRRPGLRSTSPRPGRAAARTRLVAPQTGPVDAVEPVSALALRRFLRGHSVVADLPVALSLRGSSAVWLEPAGGVGPEAARALARALVAQYVLWHGPDDALLAVVAPPYLAPEWAWVKWLPHVGHPRRSRRDRAAADGHRRRGRGPPLVGGRAGRTPAGDRPRSAAPARGRGRRGRAGSLGRGGRDHRAARGRSARAPAGAVRGPAGGRAGPAGPRGPRRRGRRAGPARRAAGRRRHGAGPASRALPPRRRRRGRCGRSAQLRGPAGADRPAAWPAG